MMSAKSTSEGLDATTEIATTAARITQSGTHEQLMRAGGHYQEIAAAQLYPDGEMPVEDGEEDEPGPSHMDRIRDEQPRPRAAG